LAEILVAHGRPVILCAEGQWAGVWDLERLTMTRRFLRAVGSDQGQGWEQPMRPRTCPVCSSEQIIILKYARAGHILGHSRVVLHRPGISRPVLHSLPD
jgi:hypothetical protein